MISLNLRHLEAISAIRRERSFGAAASEMNLTQSALTQAVAGLEKRIGVRLFERGARGTEPTLAGTLLADSVDRAVDIFNSAALSVSSRAGRPLELRQTTGTQLLSLTSVERARSFRGGARTAGLTQASVHQAVRDLEGSLGVDLFVKNRSGVDPTPAAVLMARAARQVMTEIHAGLDAARESSIKKCAVGLTPLGSTDLFPHAVAEICARDPEVCFQVREGGYGELAKQLLDGEIDMIVGALPNEEPDGLVHHHFLHDEVMVVASTGHPLARRGKLELEELGRFPWVLPPVGTPRRDRWDAMFDAGRIIPPVPRVECVSIASTRSLLLKGDWLSVMVPSQFEAEQRAGVLTALPVPAMSACPVGVAVREGWIPTEVGAAVLEALSEASDRAKSQACGRPTLTFLVPA